MKKTIFFFLFVIGCSTLNAQQKYDDDDDRKRGFRWGVGLSYGSRIESFGLHGNAEFFLSKGFSLSPEVNFFFGDNDHSWWAFNLDGHIYFSGSQYASIYALGGLNFATYSHHHGKHKHHDKNDNETAVGGNIGVGANFHVDARVVPFVQLKFVLSGLDQAVLTFGIRF